MIKFFKLSSVREDKIEARVSLLLNNIVKIIEIKVKVKSDYIKKRIKDCTKRT